ncbi:MAG: hypothetical protein KF699_01830 [Phycisphaeraceae bacterium]|nr:hypothetical protein [Phycisphaeraceae bacterium]
MENVPEFVGLDYHSKSVQVCVVDGEGTVSNALASSAKWGARLSELRGGDHRHVAHFPRAAPLPLGVARGRSPIALRLHVLVGGHDDTRTHAPVNEILTRNTDSAGGVELSDAGSGMSDGGCAAQGPILLAGGTIAPPEASPCAHA